MKKYNKLDKLELTSYNRLLSVKVAHKPHELKEGRFNSSNSHFIVSRMFGVAIPNRLKTFFLHSPTDIHTYPSILLDKNRTGWFNTSFFHQSFYSPTSTPRRTNHKLWRFTPISSRVLFMFSPREIKRFKYTTTYDIS